MIGAVTAIAARYDPTVAPAVANEPVNERTWSNIESDSVPMDNRERNAMITILPTSGSSRNAR